MSSLKILKLSQNNFSGTLPDNLCQYLPNIQAIYLTENHLSGQIPSRFLECKQLGMVSLARNNFQGNIPKSIANLTRATNIYLGENALTGLVPEEIGSLRYLETLNLYKNALKGPVPELLFNMSSLKTLVLALNSLNGTLPQNLCQHLPKIQLMYLDQNDMSGQISARLSECKQLGILSLWDNNFHGSIPKTIANLTSTSDIFLNNNQLTGTLPQAIGNLASLQNLYLHYNNISGRIPSTLFNLTTIKVISLLSNQLSGGLPPNCGLYVPNLIQLYLNTNDLGGSLPESISNASQLAHLDISFNHFSGSIPNTFRALNNLNWLALQNNSLTLIDSPDNILSVIPTFTQLKYVTLAFNPLGNTLPSSIGSNVSTTLEQLHLNNCNLTGHVPATLANFTSLIIVNLGVNQLSGSIPPSVGMLQKLQGLDLSDNMLDGPIPSELCRLRFMSELDLHNNTLSGSIPQCLGDTTSLRKLNLASNKFSSTVPPTIWSITDILELDLSSNSLTGLLPTDIGKLKALTYFNVSNNQLSGSISKSIGDLQSLTTLGLGNNNFQGSIPDSMGNLLSLQKLDLSDNILSGVIPKSFENLSDLTFLNLSFNKLYGEIPSGGPFSKFSAQSFRQNGKLCGASRLQVPPCKSAPKANKALVLKCVIASVIVVALVVIMILLIIAFRRHNVEPDSETVLFTQNRVSRFELSTATNGFKDENLIGIGSFGSVYKGTLSDGLVVAIKVFNLQLEEAFESFASECEVLCNVRHRNLLKIITCCSSPDFKALVLQYMPHGSLDKRLYSDGFFLNVLQRLNIMIDVASALEYLHYGYLTPIVHCDLKPSNVLLDENMVARVADLAMAKLLCGEDSMTQTMTLATIGYMAPEYGVGGVVSRKGDVYSFGIMLMEVFTKKKPMDDMFGEEMNLKKWVENSIPKMTGEVVDDDLLRPENKEYLVDKDCVASVLELALACSASSPEERVDMKIAVATLNKIKIKYLKDSRGNVNV